MPLSKHRRRRRRQTPGSSSRLRSAVNSRRKSKPNYLYLAASGLIAVLVIAGFALGSVNLGTGNLGRSGSSSQYVTDVGEPQPIMPSTDHIPEGQSISYNTTPPTSGEMWGRTATCGFYEGGLPDELITHNLEHGNIVVSYNLAAQEDVQELRQIMDDLGSANIWGVTRFYDQISPGQIALAAWGVLDTFEGVDRNRITRFFDTYAGSLGPEQAIC